MVELEHYRQKRDFTKTSEPAGETGSESAEAPAGEGVFVVQKHEASRLHYDFRLQWGEVLKSWAVPRGPSLNPAERRLAILVEDHPLDYGNFEGRIPEANYGAGRVLLWDRGRYSLITEQDEARDFETLHSHGQIVFTLWGEKLQGGWALIRTAFGKRQNSWLLIKKRDTYADRERDILTDEPRSVKTGRRLEDI